MMNELQWCQQEESKTSIIKVPLHFLYPPVEALSKELTRLNSNHEFRIVYLGPRWENSVVFHKKYSNQKTYDFEHRRVSKNNSLLNDTMNHNQFYRNQLYYRAFEGMNPTLNLKQELTFESRFQSGNLDCVVKVNDFEYDLFLRIDSNTRGNINWFYFGIKSPKTAKFKFNICNLTKGATHFSKQGLASFSVFHQNPHLVSITDYQCLFLAKEVTLFSFIAKLGLFYELAFQVEFNEQQEVKIAYSIPYTYSDLMSDMKAIQKVAQVRILGQSLTGVDIPVVAFGNGNASEQNYKPVVVITGRIHPSQTNSSWVLSKLMKQLSFSQQMRYLREKLIIVIVPMVNPDGVILGNSRTGASGKDLNRQFKTKNNSLFPEIAAIKKLVKTIQQTHIIQFYFDFHGHSRRKNVFMFGPSFNISQAQYYKCRVFPKMLSQNTPIFRYYGCNYQIPPEKRGTARAIMLNEMLISFVFTVETSLGFYDEKDRRGLAFSRQKWEEFGSLFLLTLRQYQEIIEQMRYFSSKNNEKQIQSPGKKYKKEQLKQTDKKMSKMQRLYEAIVMQESKKKKQAKKERQSDASSDSHDERQELQREKMSEFMSMVTDFVEVQQKKAQAELNQKKDRALSQNLETGKFKLLLQKRLHENKEFEAFLFDPIQLERKQRKSRKEIRTENKVRKGELLILKRQNVEVSRSEIFSHLEKRGNEIKLSQKQIAERPRHKIQHKESEEESSSNFFEKRSHRRNLRMFNFSKIIQSPERIKKNQENTAFSFKYMMSNKLEKRSLQKNNKRKYDASNESLEVSLQKLERSSDDQKSFGLIINHSTQQMKKIELKHRVPTNFYRIKHYQLLKKNQLKGKFFVDSHQDQKTNLDKSNQSLKRQIVQPSPNQSQKNRKAKYAQINQFPIL